MELGAGLGTKMVEWHRVMPITKMVDGDGVEWAPYLGRADEDCWWAKGLQSAVEEARPERGLLLGATDGSQLRTEGFYGWMNIDHKAK